MLCKDLKDEIFEAALSGVAPGDNVKVHMSACDACEKEYQSLRSTMNVLDAWTAPEPSPYFDVRLRARLRDSKEQEQQGRVAGWLEKFGFGRISWKPLTAAAFTMIMAVAGGLYVVDNQTHDISGQHRLQAACPVVDLQALDKNLQVLNELQDLDEDSSNGTQTPVNE